MSTKIVLTIRRPNGQIEEVDVSNKFPSANPNILWIAYNQTKNAGRGEILKATVTEHKSNIDELIRRYNNVVNEGGEGYLPDYSYFRKNPKYREWEETTEIEPKPCEQINFSDCDW